MLLKLTELAPSGSRADDILTLPFDSRQKSRFSAKTDNGRDVGLLFQPLVKTMHFSARLLVYSHL